MVILVTVVVRYTYEDVGTGDYSSTRKVSETFLAEELLRRIEENTSMCVGIVSGIERNVISKLVCSLNSEVSSNYLAAYN